MSVTVNGPQVKVSVAGAGISVVTVGQQGPAGTAADTAAAIHGADSKATPVDADELGLVDSAAASILKKFTWANLKKAIASYFGTLAGDKQVLFNDAGAIAGNSGLTFDKSTGILSAAGLVAGSGADLNVGANNVTRLNVAANGQVTLVSPGITNQYGLVLSNLGAGNGGLLMSWGNGNANAGIQNSGNKFTIDTVNQGVGGMKFQSRGTADPAGLYQFLSDSGSGPGSDVYALFPTSWNNAAKTYTGLKFNVTDTASAAGSLLLDLQVSDLSRFSVKKDGTVNVRGNGRYLSFSALAGFGHNAGGENPYVTANGTTPMSWQSNAALVSNNASLGWTTGVAASTGGDTFLWRGGPGIIEQRNGANAQTFRLANTWTSASVNEFGKIGFNSDVLEIGAEANGTGTLRAVKFIGAGFTFANPDKAASFTVATLPSPSTSGAGTRAYAIDLASLTNGAIAVGGGSGNGTVISNGVNWIVLG